MTAPLAELAAAVGFECPERYNASRLLWDNLARDPDAPAVIHDDGVLSYAGLAALAARFGHRLRETCAPGDRVLMFMDDEPAYPAAIMGAMRAGLVPMLINTLSPPDLIRFFLEDSGAAAAVVGAGFEPLFEGAEVTIIRPTDVRRMSDAGPTLPEHPTSRRDMAFWMYSSGSTGRPKGVVHKHEDPAYTAATWAADVLKLGPGDICFSVPKIYFAYGFGNSVTFPMAAGAASVLLTGRPDPARVFDAIARHRPTHFFGLPTLYTALARSGAAAGADLSSVRLCLSAAEILSADIAGAWRDRFGLEIVEGLGSTEMLHIYLSNRPGAVRQGSAGQAVPGYAIRLVTPEGDPAGPGEEGTMQVAGLSGAEYYWNRPDKTAETMRDGWLDTGDRFTVDSEGYYFFKGRADDLVKVSGQWVWPMEIELALNEHPEVHESCVLALKLADERMTILAFVAPAAGAAPDAALAARLKDFAKTSLLPHKYPREIRFLDALPKTGTDKIDRQALKRLAQPPEDAT
jgi:benzoate-CoA ligase family protein